MNKKNLAGAAVAALAAAVAASAAETHRCASLFDDAQRLACYDGTYGKPVRPAGPPAPATPATTTVIATPAAPVPARPPAVAIQPAPVPAAAAAPAPKPAAKAKDEPVSGRIVAVGRLPNERFAVTLDNGQLWTQLERDLTAEVKVGDTVQVRPAMLGSWMLETEGGVKTRVRLTR